MRTSPQQGISLIEVLVAVSILSVALVFINYTITLFVSARTELLADAKTLYLAEEGYELVRALRDDNWSTIDGLSLDTDYALSVSTTTLGLGSVPELIDDEYRRRFEVRALYRDSGDDDVTASTTPGAVVDANGRELIVTVGGPTGTTSVRAILTNLFEL